MEFKTIREQLESSWWTEYKERSDTQYYSVNVQQLAKNPIFLDCLKAPKGYKFVQLDFTALEPNVLAEFSGCPTYKEIYASGKPHDVYFYVSCKLLDKDGSMAQIYRPDNPTKETVKAAKKQFKPERSIGKVFQLMSTYKAGAPAIYRKLRILGIDISQEEVQENREKYWSRDIFGAVLDFEEGLHAEVDQRDGWMMNATGRPFVVTDKKRKDVVNIFCQSSGHDYLDIFVTHLGQIIKERQLDAKPVIDDYHDETIWMIKEDEAYDLADAMVDALKKTNDMVKLGIPLRGEPEVTDTFTEFKGPDAVEFYTEFLNEQDDRRKDKSKDKKCAKKDLELVHREAQCTQRSKAAKGSVPVQRMQTGS